MAPAALERMTPEAQRAAAARSPEVARYLKSKEPEAKPERRPEPSQNREAGKPAAAPARAQRGGSFGTRRAARVFSGAAGAVSSASSSVSTQSGRTGMLGRLLAAFAVGLVALEVASYATGNYFSWDLKAGATRLKAASQHVDLYPGQSADLAARTITTPAATGAGGHPYVGHGGAA